jgi:hypothetical protein
MVLHSKLSGSFHGSWFVPLSFLCLIRAGGFTHVNFATISLCLADSFNRGQVNNSHQPKMSTFRMWNLVRSRQSVQMMPLHTNFERRKSKS